MGIVEVNHVFQGLEDATVHLANQLMKASKRSGRKSRADDFGIRMEFAKSVC
jgi:hypothetical protein